jgi:hypothetical protein
VGSGEWACSTVNDCPDKEEEEDEEDGIGSLDEHGMNEIMFNIESGKITQTLITYIHTLALSPKG